MLMIIIGGDLKKKQNIKNSVFFLIEYKLISLFIQNVNSCLHFIIKLKYAYCKNFTKYRKVEKNDLLSHNDILQKQNAFC